MSNLIVERIIYLTDAGNVVVDSALKRLINSFFGKTDASLDDDITAMDLAAIDFIDATYDSSITVNKVQSLAGLNSAARLIGIDISGNEVISINELSEINSLNYLEAAENKITDLQNINSCLGILGLQKNGIKIISGISRALGIIELNLAGNEIEDISELITLKSLNKVVLSNNSIADVSILKEFQVTDSEAQKWAALGGQSIEFSPVYYEKENDNIIITLPLTGKLKDLKGNVPQVIKNIIYKDLNDEITVIGNYDDNTKIINYQTREIPKLISFDFNTTRDDTLADSFNGNVISYVAIKIENDLIKKYINEKIEEAGGIEKDPILYKDYKEKGIDTLRVINLSNKGLVNLKDIDLFPGAVEINVSNNSLVDMSDLFKLNNIRDINISAINQSNEFEDTIILGQNYSFNLNKLSINETGNHKFEVEFLISDISHKGVYNSTNNTIKWIDLKQDTVLTFNYSKYYKEGSEITGAAIGGLAAGEPYENIVNDGVARINLFVNVGRGLNLF